MSLQEHTAILAIGETRLIPIIADELQFFSVTGSFRFGLRPGEMVTGREGDTLEGITGGVYVTNTDAGATTLSIRYGTGIRFGQSDNVTISGIANVAISDWHDPDAVATPVDVVVAFGDQEMVSAARATKRETLIVNNSALASVRIGPVTVDATRGPTLLPGGSVRVPGEAALYAHNTHASAAATLEILETDKL